MAEETIFALSSGAGKCGVAVIRVSGPGARFALETMAGRPPAPRQATVRAIRNRNGEILDRALVLWLPAPHSFTGEDMAEFHVHGGRAVLAAVLDELAGLPDFRPADAGEFTRRAFVGGKLDLTAVEGLADLIDAETEAQRRAALRQADGALDALYGDWRVQVLALRALAEAAIDFIDEDDVPTDAVEQIGTGLSALIPALADHLDRGARSQRLRDGVMVAVVGAPNAGKSSLVNALAGRDVAIVDAEAGTTRDVIEVRLDLAGVPVSLIDTAGIRETGSRVEAEGIRRARDAMGRADLAIELIDSSAIQQHVREEQENRIGDSGENVECWRILSKSDLATDASCDVGGSGSTFRHAISVHTGAGVDALLGDLTDFVADRAGLTESAGMTRARHRAGVSAAHRNLLRAVEVCDIASLELCAEELRAAGDALGRLTGAIDSEEVLGEIFSSFCIGK